MKRSKKMQVLFFLMIPASLIVLLLSVRMVRKTFSGNIILELPYLQKTAQFTISKPGNYSVWHKGQIFRKAPLDRFRPVITSDSTGNEIFLTSLLFRPNTNNGITARMEIFRFSAPAGHYTLELKEGSSISGIENSVIKQLPFKMADLDQYYIQIRQSQPFFIVIIGIVLMALSGFGIIGGLVLGILAKQIYGG